MNFLCRRPERSNPYSWSVGCRSVRTCNRYPARALQETNADILARIALVADTHLNLETNGEDAAFAPHFDKAIAQVNAARVDFVLIAGDLTQSGKPEEYADFKAKLKAFHAPVWFVPGNHDVGNKFNSGKSEHVTRARVRDYEEKMGPDWFSTNAAGVRIIGIDSSLLGSGLEREKDMWMFLESELAAPVPVPTLFVHALSAFCERPGRTRRRLLVTLSPRRGRVCMDC